MEKKFLLIIFVIIGIFSFSFGTVFLYKLNVSNSCNIDEEKISDFDNIEYIESFDVSDFSSVEVNKINIKNKKYNSNSITVLDSNYKISEKLLNDIYINLSDYGAACSFYIVSLSDGMSIGYNVDRQFETASSIKAPYGLYVYHEIANGNIDPEQKIVYKEKYYSKGTGVIKTFDFGTEFTVRDLVYYSVNDSDNVAHQMLHGTFGVSGYNKMLKSLGTKQLYLTNNNPWGFTSARSAALVWQDIYNFAITDSEGITFLNILSNNKYNYYKEVMPNIPSASKTGFANKDVVETGIVFDDKPYIAIAIANKGGNNSAYKEVLKLISFMNDIMNEYKKYSLE